MATSKPPIDHGKLDRVVADARARDAINASWGYLSVR